jgi:hypothetical protein
MSNLLQEVTATGVGTPVESEACNKDFTFFASGATSSGAGAATILVQVSDAIAPDTNDWMTLGTIGLTLSTTKAVDGFAATAPWRWIRGNVTAISGTGAEVSLKMRRC